MNAPLPVAIRKNGRSACLATRAEAKPMPSEASTSVCQWAWLFIRAMPMYVGTSASDQIAGRSSRYSRMKGDTTAAASATSSLGKL
jgi:hypothetical protein